MADELNEQKAFLTWAESAAVLQTDARQGIARAQRLLAMRYLGGRGVPKDEAIAFYWMQLAAQQNFAMAQRSLGELYENGSGIALDITIASHWYRRCRSSKLNPTTPVKSPSAVPMRMAAAKSASSPA